MVRRQTWQAQRFEIFESARHSQIESNRDVRFEFESNLEASQVPSITRKLLKIDRYMQRGVWQALNCLFIHAMFCMVATGASPGQTKNEGRGT